MIIKGIFTTKSPLSHISESISTGSLLNERRIMQGNGELVDVFCYNANALRGQLRDQCALYLIAKTGIEHLSAEHHNFLFSGGKIGGASKFDLHLMQNHFRLLPHFALLGGCLNNMMLPGKSAFLDLLPLCQEAIAELPSNLHSKAVENTYKRMTIEREFVRKDDSKDMRLNQTLVSDKEKEATQMRMGGELLNSGVDLFSRIILNNANDLEIGALCSAFIMFAKHPFIGGQHNKGHGLVDVEYFIEEELFFKVVDFEIKQGDKFKKCLALYDQHLANNADEIKGLFQ